MSSGGKKNKSQVTGYKYSMSVHMGIGRGPINELKEIRIGDLVAWDTGTTVAGFQTIDKPNLFGGDQKEGGITGRFRLYMGEPTQTLDSIVTDVLRAPIPGWRGVATIFYDGQVSSNNPYPKAWKMRVRRTTAGWDDNDPWYPDKALIVLADDPVSIVTFYANPESGNTLTINGVGVTFGSGAGPIYVTIGGSVDETVANFITTVNINSTTLGSITAEGSGNVAELRFISGSGDPSVVSSYGYGTVTAVGGGGSVHAMNPAHIIYECATNNVWGRGLPRSIIDDDAFRTAADTLYSEGLGLCLRWNRQEDIDQFVQTIVNHIGAVIQIDRRTGLLTLKLIRNDYDADDLTAYTFENGLIDISEDQSTAADTIYNEIIVKFNNPNVDQIGQVRVQNLASFQSLGTLISTTVEYLGCATGVLALRLAQRDLQVNSSNLRKLTVKMDRAGWQIGPGDVFKIHVPTRGIENMVLRAGAVEDGPLTDGTITINAVQDVFSLPDTTFIKEQESLWTPPDRSARVVTDRLLTEVTYYDLADNLPTANLDTVVADEGFIKVFAKPPNGSQINYKLATEADGEASFEERATGHWDARAKLTAAISYYDTDISFDRGSTLSEVSLDIPLLIDDEYVRVDAFDADAGTVTIARGCIDTIPAPHDINAVLWFQSFSPTSDYRDYATGELIHVKLLSQTTTAELDPAIAPIDDITIASRQGRPYPPGDLRIGGTPWANVSFVVGDIVLTWTHRDRITQGNTLLEHGAASTGPESDVTYTARVYATDGTTLLRTVSGISGTTWTYTSAMAIADGDLFAYWFELESVRDGIASYQYYRFELLTGEVGFDEDFNYNFDGGSP